MFLIGIIVVNVVVAGGSSSYYYTSLPQTGSSTLLMREWDGSLKA